MLTKSFVVTIDYHEDSLVHNPTSFSIEQCVSNQGHQVYAKEITEDNLYDFYYYNHNFPQRNSFDYSPPSGPMMHPLCLHINSDCWNDGCPDYLFRFFSIHLET